MRDMPALFSGGEPARTKFDRLAEEVQQKAGFIRSDAGRQPVRDRRTVITTARGLLGEVEGGLDPVDARSELGGRIREVILSEAGERAAEAEKTLADRTADAVADGFKSSAGIMTNAGFKDAEARLPDMYDVESADKLFCGALGTANSSNCLVRIAQTRRGLLSPVKRSLEDKVSTMRHEFGHVYQFCLSQLSRCGFKEADEWMDGAKDLFPALNGLPPYDPAWRRGGYWGQPTERLARAIQMAAENGGIPGFKPVGMHGRGEELDNLAKSDAAELEGLFARLFGMVLALLAGPARSARRYFPDIFRSRSSRSRASPG
jgi:hypothetical protein